MYLLTGATGFVGGVLARQLVAAGHSLRAIVRTPGNAGALRELGVELHPGDVTDKASMRAPMTGVDGVFHVAGWYRLGVTARDRAIAEATNVHGTRNVLELMRELRVPKGVYTSTLAVNSDTHGELVDENYRFDGRHLSIYDETKARAHDVASEFIAGGLPLVIVQPGVIYGPGDTSSLKTTLLQFLQRKLPAIPARTAFCWAHVDDVAHGHVLAMQRGQAGRNYFICGPVHTMEEGLQVASEVSGVPMPRMRLRPGMMRAMSTVTAVIEQVVTLPADYASETLRAMAGTTYIGSNARAKAELGWTVRELRDGWAETVRYEAGLLALSAR
ncbi:MAG TPA: NAD-dependent epimerase/dehydratase family protein [Vicinamibacterales bacterium]|nr:NAD-dependent epimerase/dehydratase family protein [Vicinamibacterales bacterium]